MRKDFANFAHHFPNKTRGSDSTDCLACKHGRGHGGECRRNNVGYVLICDEFGGNEVSWGGRQEKTCTQGGLDTWPTTRGNIQTHPYGNTTRWFMGGTVQWVSQWRLSRALETPLHARSMRQSGFQIVVQLHSSTPKQNGMVLLQLGWLLKEVGGGDLRVGKYLLKLREEFESDYEQLYD